MQAFAFLAVLVLFVGLPLGSARLRWDAKCYFLVFFLLAAAVSEVLRGAGLHEGLILTVFYISVALVLCSLPIAETPKLVSAYLFIVLLAGMFNALIVCAQQWDVQGSLPFTSAGFDATRGLRPYGNLGQPNLVATLILTAMLCSLYFQLEGKLHWSLHACVLALGALGLAFAASRAAFLALLLLFVFSALRRDWRALASFFGAAVVILLARTWSVGPSRALVGTEVSSGRFDLWRIVLDGLGQSPWWGYGAMNTRLAQFAATDTHIFTQNSAIGSSHNLFLDFLVWFGIPLGLLVGVLFIRVILNFFRSTKKSSMAYLLVPLLVHSLLEYPLHNASFLFLFVFIIKIAEPVKYQEKQNNIFPYMFLFLSLILGGVVVYDYIRLAYNYNELRFFKNGIVGVDKPKSLQPIVLDTAIGQYNILLQDEIKSVQQVKYIEQLTPYSPSFKNFWLLTHYYHQHGATEKYNYWLKKSSAYLSEPYMVYVRMPIGGSTMPPQPSLPMDSDRTSGHQSTL